MTMLVSGSVDINSNKYVSFYVTSALLIEPRLGWNQRQAETSTYGFWSKLSSSWKPRVHCWIPAFYLGFRITFVVTAR